MARRTLALGMWLLLLSAGTASWAILPTTPHGGEVSRPARMVAPEFRGMEAAEAIRVLPGWESFLRSEGAGWIVGQYRDDLQAPAALYGPGIDLVAPEVSDEALGAAARRFAAEKAAILHAEPEGLGAAEVISLTGEKRFVIVHQTYQGLEVIGGRVDLSFDGGKLVFAGSGFYPGIRISTQPAWSAERAQAAAIGGLDFQPATDTFLETPRLVVFPLVLADGPHYFLAWEVKFQTANPVGLWWTYVDASDGTILSRVNHAATFDIPTTVTTDVQPNYSTDGQVTLASPDHYVSVNGEFFYTDVDGHVTLSVPVDSGYTVTSQLKGRYCNVNRYEGGDAEWSGEGTPGTPLAIEWDDSNSQVQERDAYYSVNRIHTWIKQIDPNFTSLDVQVPAIVNRTDGTCNAFWNGSSVNFYAAGGGCVNMATVSDVVMHEYGHGITQKTYFPDGSPTESGMGEGFSDMCAQTVTNDRYVGKTVYNGGGFIRDGENTRQYPGTSCGGEVHCLGEIFMGANWKARKFITQTRGYGLGKAQYDEIFRAAWKTKQFSMPSYLTQLLVADDDNANLADGTPNYPEICAAYSLHNIPCPGITQLIFFSFEPTADMETVDTPIDVTCYIEPQNSGNLIPDSTEVHYSLDLGQTWSSLVMTPTANPNEYTAQIPGQPCGTLIEYYIRACSEGGAWGTEPARAPDLAVHKLMVGPQEYPVDDNYETDQGWTIGAPGDAASAGIWQRVNPVGKTNGSVVYQPENDHTTGIGVNCYVTDGSGGGYLDGDVDGGATTILSPVLDLGAGSEGAVRLDFWAFFQNDLVVDDTLRASVSNNGGATWTDLVKISGKNTWNAWNNFVAYFSSDQVPFTSQMRFRFQVADFNASCTEAAVDDVVVSYTVCSSSEGVEDGLLRPARFVVEASRPNPTSQGSTIRFGLPRASDVRVDLFDASGRLVRSVLQQSLPAGYHQAAWDGRDGSGHPVASGVYWYQVQAGADRGTRKLLVLR